MDQEELLDKLAQIEEQASYTLAEFPKTLTKERLRMIIALARYLKAEVPVSETGRVLADVAGGTVMRDHDDTLNR